MRDHFVKTWGYTLWANERLAHVLLEHDHPEALGHLNHIIGAQEEWLSRFDPAFEKEWPLFGQRSPQECLRGNRRNILGWIDFLQAEEDETLLRLQEYRSLSGEPFVNVLRDLVAHAANHSTHHRAQIALLLRQAGVAPPPTDYIYYLRETESAIVTE